MSEVEKLRGAPGMFWGPLHEASTPSPLGIRGKRRDREKGPSRVGSRKCLAKAFLFSCCFRNPSPVCEGVKGPELSSTIGECLGHRRESGTGCVFMELLIKTKLLPFHLDEVDWVENWLRDQEICLLFLLSRRVTLLQVSPPSMSQFLHL